MIYVLAGLTLAALALTAFTLHAALGVIAADRAANALLVQQVMAENAAQISTLLQRIQAPEQAVMDHALSLPEPVPVPPVAMDDDAAQWAAVGHEISRENLADMTYAQELA